MSLYPIPRSRPTTVVANELVQDDRLHYWNSGLFLFGARTFLDELERLEPELAQACREAAAGCRVEGECRHIERAAFERCRSNSYGHASHRLVVGIGLEDVYQRATNGEAS